MSKPSEQILDATHKRLIKQYHTLASMLAMSEDQRATLLASLGVTSSRQLTQPQLIELCSTLSSELAKRDDRNALDPLRKRLIAAIGAYIELIGYQRTNIALIKSIATRAAGVTRYNDIPPHKLRALYGAFTRKARDIRFIQQQRQDQTSPPATTQTIIISIQSKQYKTMTQTDQTQVPTAPETTISPEELAAFRAYQARIQRDQRDKELRDTYAQLVDDEIDAATDMLTQLSTDMATIKETVMSNFRSVIDMKTETLGLSKPQGQYTHTFTNSDSTRRITIGNYTIDSYRDTVEDGIQLVTTYIQSLARDQDSQALVKAVMQLLSRNSKGQIKASRVLQLRKIAEEVGDQQFLRGVQIIQDSYQPEISRSFVRLEVKDPSTQTWTIVPLNISNL